MNKREILEKLTYLIENKSENWRFIRTKDVYYLSYEPEGGRMLISQNILIRRTPLTIHVLSNHRGSLYEPIITPIAVYFVPFLFLSKTGRNFLKAIRSLDGKDIRERPRVNFFYMLKKETEQ